MVLVHYKGNKKINIDLPFTSAKVLFCEQLDGLPGFARIPKIKTNQEFRKKKSKVTRPRFEHADFYVKGGYSYHLAIKANCYKSPNKQNIREHRDSMKMK